MNWHRSPELLDRLAAEYALGTMSGGARRRFEAVMQRQPEVARAAARWDARFTPLAAALPAADAGGELWTRIEGRLFGKPPPVLPWWRRLLAPAPAAALAFGLVAGLGLPSLLPSLQGEQAQLPESYVGVLAAADGRQGLIVASLRRGRTLDLKRVQEVPLPPGRALVLWTIDAGGAMQSVATLPALTTAFTSVPLPRTSEELFGRAVELAVSVEAAGPPPPAPGLPFVYRGLCGKLWPPKLAPPAVP